jgi:D-lactate dehydrogenase
MTAQSTSPVSGITFLDVEPWEAQQLSALCPASWQIRVLGQELGHVDHETLSAAEILSVFIYSQIRAETLQRLPKLRLITTRSTGVDHIDLDACRAQGVAVANVPDYGENTVAEHTFALMLALSRRIYEARSRTLRGEFSFHGLMGFDLKDKVLGVVGCGRIGRHVIRIARGFEMKVLAYDPYCDEATARTLDCEFTDWDGLLSRADVVTLHCPSTPRTLHLLNRESFARMKRGAIVLNTARGALIDTEALLWALDQGIVAGVGLDVLEHENDIREERELLATRHDDRTLCDLIRNHALLRDDRVIITPHIGFNSREAVERILKTTVENIDAFVSGRTCNRVI